MYRYDFTEKDGWRFANWKPYDKPAFDYDPPYRALYGNIAKNLAEAIALLSAYIGVQVLTSRSSDMKQLAIAFIAYGAALITMGRLFYRSSYKPQDDVEKLLPKPSDDAIKAKCTQPEAYGWLYIESGMLLFDSPWYAVQLSPEEFRFIDDPDSQFFRGELKSEANGKSNHTIRFIPAGVNWARTPAQIQFEKIAKQYQSEAHGIEPSVLPPVTPAPICSSIPTPPKKLAAAVTTCGFILAGATVWICWQFFQIGLEKVAWYCASFTAVVILWSVVARLLLPKWRRVRLTS